MAKISKDVKNKKLKNVFISKKLEERGKSFYIRSTVLMIGLATFGVINYSLLLNNPSFYVYALVNNFSGVLPVSPTGLGSLSGTCSM